MLPRVYVTDDWFMLDNIGTLPSADPIPPERPCSTPILQMFVNISYLNSWFSIHSDRRSEDGVKLSEQGRTGVYRDLLGPTGAY